MSNKMLIGRTQEEIQVAVQRLHTAHRRPGHRHAPPEPGIRHFYDESIKGVPPLVTHLFDALWVHEFEETLKFDFKGIQAYYDREEDRVRLKYGHHVEMYVFRFTKGRLRLYRVRYRGAKAEWRDASNDAQYFFQQFLGRISQHCESVRGEVYFAIQDFFERFGIHNLFQVRDRTRDAGYRTLANHIEEVMFPLMRDSNNQLPQPYARGFMRMHSPRAVLEALVGKRYVTKPLVRAFQADLHRPDYAFSKAMGYRFWRDFVSPDHLVRLSTLERIPGYEAMEPMYGRVRCVDPTMRVFMRAFIDAYGVQRVFNMTMDDDQTGHNAYVFGDMARMYRMRQTPAFPDQARSYDEVHDFFVPQMPWHGRDPFGVDGGPQDAIVDIPQDPYLDIDGTKVGDYTFLTPKTTQDLLMWGSQMRNCIGTYRWDAVDGKSLLLAVLDDRGKVRVNIQITDGLVRQMFAHANRKLSVPDINMFMAHLLGHGVIKSDSKFWGDTRAQG